MKNLILSAFTGLIIILSFGFNNHYKISEKQIVKNENESSKLPYIKVLGIAQDAGYPHAGCTDDCCFSAGPLRPQKSMVSSLAIVDPLDKACWILDATPDFTHQLFLASKDSFELHGIFLTHAHIGHYTGLMYLGREAMGSKGTPVYAMPRMKKYLETNGPWSQLVDLGNIDIKPIQDQKAVKLNDRISITPFLVPHRDEFSETVGFIIQGVKRSAIFIPDIDKWDKWEGNSIVEMVKQHDILFLDATFYANGEVPGRDMSEIPHPFMEESMKLFQGLSEAEKARIHFIHFNHTNPVLNPGSNAYKRVIKEGYRVSEELQEIDL